MTDFPAVSSTLSVDGLDYAYVEAGHGPTVVLVHGNPSWSFYFRRLLAELPARGYRALAPDHIGMGRSAKPARADYPHTLARRVADFEAVLDAVAPTGPLTLVVHDWGGAIALTWAVAHPERVQRLVLLNTAAFPFPGRRPLPLALRAARWPVLGGLAVRYGNAFARGATHLGVHRRMPATTRAGLLAPYDRPEHRVAVHEFVKDVPTAPGDTSWDTLAATAAALPALAGRPVLICWGMRDFVLDAAVLTEWERLFPEAQVHRFADAGHYVLEDAAEEITDLVVEFLARTDAADRQPGVEPPAGTPPAAG